MPRGRPPRPASAEELLTIGELAARSGLATSALRFYQAKGLISGGRTAGGQRRYPKHMLRRVAFIRAAQSMGLDLVQVTSALNSLPAGRTPTKADWQALSSTWLPILDKRIRDLQLLRAKLTSCIGCGCLSLKACRLYNPADLASELGPGARYLLGDRPRAELARGR